MNGWFVNDAHPATDDQSLCQWTGVVCENGTLFSLDLTGYSAQRWVGRPLPIRPYALLMDCMPIMFCAPKYIHSSMTTDFSISYRQEGAQMSSCQQTTSTAVHMYACQSFNIFYYRQTADIPAMVRDAVQRALSAAS